MTRQEAAELDEVRDELRASEARIKRERRFLRVLLDNLEEAIVACDAEGNMTVSNPASERLYGAQPDRAGAAERGVDLLRPDGSPMSGDEAPLRRALRGESVRGQEMVIVTRGGQERTILANGQAMVDENGEKLGAVVAMRDITEQKTFEAELARLALHDPLTGLANRVLLAERMQMSLEHARREGLDVAVLMIDLDGFKAVNDTFGHDLGDKILVAVTERLTAAVRPSDTVARLGGDEFVIVCAISREGDDLVRLLDRLYEALAAPYAIDGRQVSLKASIGAAVSDPGCDDLARVLNDADLAMYRHKQSGSVATVGECASRRSAHTA